MLILIYHVAKTLCETLFLKSFSANQRLYLVLLKSVHTVITKSIGTPLHYIHRCIYILNNQVQTILNFVLFSSTYSCD